MRFHPEGDFDALVEEFGLTPLPPYIRREGEDLASGAEDRERYQTVYAAPRGAIAAPTAGLHFTPRVLEEVEARGVRVVALTLHVGYGTFAPVRVEELSEHRVAPESFEIGGEAAGREGGRDADGVCCAAVCAGAGCGVDAPQPASAARTATARCRRALDIAQS